MQVLKTFIGPDGVKRRAGDKVPSDWDRQRLDHYRHHGMVGETPVTSKVAPKNQQKLKVQQAQAAEPDEASTAEPDEAPQNQST